MKTRVTELLGIEYPIIQGGMAGGRSSHCGSSIRGRRPGTDRSGKRTGRVGA